MGAGPSLHFADRNVKVWDFDDGRDVRTLQGHSDSVHAVAVVRDGARVISASKDRTLRVWNLEDDSGRRVPKDHNGDVSGIAATRDGRRAVSASADHTVK